MQDPFARLMRVGEFQKDVMLEASTSLLFAAGM
jgi:hypothetical protein